MVWSTRCGLMWLANALLVSLAAAAPQPMPISTAELCELLSRQREATDGLTIRFNVESHYGKGSSNPPAEHLLGPKTLTQQHTVESLRIGDCYRVNDDFVYRTVDEGVEEFTKMQKVMTWNGVECRVLMRPPETPDAGFLSISAEPASDVFAQFYMTWQGWWLVQGPERVGFIDLLQRGDVQGPELLSDGKTRWRFGPNPISKANEIFILARRVGDDIELAEAHFRIYSEGIVTGNDADLTTTTIFEFGPVRKDRGEALPGTCVGKSCFWMQRGSENDFWSYARIDLTSVERAVVNDTTFREPPGPKSGVGDQRYRIAYDQGSQYITVDGRVLKTHEPVHGDSVGHQLEWWVERGSWDDVPKQAATQSAKPHQESDAR